MGSRCGSNSCFWVKIPQVFNNIIIPQIYTLPPLLFVTTFFSVQANNIAEIERNLHLILRAHKVVHSHGQKVWRTFRGRSRCLRQCWHSCLFWRPSWCLFILQRKILDPDLIWFNKGLTGRTIVLYISIVWYLQQRAHSWQGSNRLFRSIHLSTTRLAFRARQSHHRSLIEKIRYFSHPLNGKN